MFKKQYLISNLFLILFFNATIVVAEDKKAPIDLEKAITLSQSKGKFVPDKNKSKNFTTPPNIKLIFSDTANKIQQDDLKNVGRSNEPRTIPLEFGPIFNVAGKDGFDVYFLKVHQYNNIMGLPFDKYYFVVFDKKTKKCSGKSFLIQGNFVDCYWDNLTNDGRVQLVIDDEWHNGSAEYFDKKYYEIKDDLSIKELLALGGFVDGPHSQEQKIIQKKKKSVVVEETWNNSDIEDGETKAVTEVKLEF